MTLRRNVITLIVWISILAIFTIHLILTRSNDATKNRVLVEREILGSQHDHVKDKARKPKGSYVKYTHTNDASGAGVFQSIKSFFDKGYERMNSRLEKNKQKSPRRNEKLKQNRAEIGSSKNVGHNFDHADVDNDDDEEGSTRKEQNKMAASCKSSEQNITYLLKVIKNIELEVEKLKNENIKMNSKEKQYKTKIKTLETKLSKSEEQQYPRYDYSKPWVFAITPTYARYTQKADLVRLSQTLFLVKNIHWIIVEDSDRPTDLVAKLLTDSGLSFTHLNVRTPVQLQRKKWEKRNKHHRGVLQRNLGLKWIRDNVDDSKTPGAVYFMDDDNTYHRSIFDEMRYTRRVSVWPVAFTGGLRWAGPIVVNGTVSGFRTDWAPDRTFPLDMAGFAVSLSYLINEKPHVNFNMSAKRGYLEPNFLEQLTTVKDAEPLAEDCTKVLVWHTRTENPKENIKGERAYVKKEDKTNVPNIEV